MANDSQLSSVYQKELQSKWCRAWAQFGLKISKHGSVVPPWARCSASLRHPPCMLSPAWTPTCHWRGWFEAPPSFWHPTSWLSLAACCAAASSCRRVWSGSPPSVSAACRLRKQSKQTTKGKPKGLFWAIWIAKNKWRLVSRFQLPCWF